MGFIRYYCKAKIDRPFKIDDTACEGVTVLPRSDLNSMQYAINPQVRNLEKVMTSCCCFNHGLIQAKVSFFNAMALLLHILYFFLQISISKCGYVPGQLINLSVEIFNNSSINISNIETSLREISTFVAHRGGGGGYYGGGYGGPSILTRQRENIVFRHEEKINVSFFCTLNFDFRITLIV